ncbi:MAG: MBL fold metallo-hydrolase [Deltaproteobacteria bacterium]|nr:MBL fold metallo-hydrolase [Deltaproteobacteria bacterium]
MKLIILGSGTSIPLADRASPSLALIVAGSPILFDMGPGTLCQMTRAGLDFEKIEQIFITHFHPDHTADLIHFLFASRSPSIVKRRNPFVITGPRGLKDLVLKLQSAYPDWLTLPSDVMEIEELEIGKTTTKDYEGFRITVCPTNHTQHSLAYRIETITGKSVVYSGDTGFCDDVVDLAQGADLLILECSFPDGMEVEGHLTPALAGKIADMANVNKLVLTHFYPECLKTDIETQCRKTFQGELILGKDLLEIRI